ncbi:MAG TPA: DegV family protein [Erysipelotrichaceae bacterium]|nr:DegV family protein [Erysipelotrichaceae bacterium]
MKENFAIMTDIGGDFTREIIKKYDIEETPMSKIVWPSGEERDADLYWETMSSDEFFSLMSVKKNNFYSSISSPQTMDERLSILAKKGRNVIVITISSTMSGGYSAYTVASKEVMEKYPSVKIEVIDSLRYGAAISLMAIEASLCREKGMSFDETVNYLKHFRKRIHQCGTLDDLFFLARKGRISRGVAFMGNMIGIKPIAELCNETGQSTVIGKARGYNQLLKIFPKYIQRTIGDYRNKVFVITYSGREKQALEMKKIIEQTFNPQHLIVVPVGQSTGCNVGPGLVATFYAGDEQISINCVKEKAILDDLLRK